MNDVLTLISKPFPDRNPIYNEIYCDIKSVNRYEFYKASSQGIIPEIVFSVFKWDYNSETRILFDNKLYNIIRTYQRPNERLELVCAGFQLGQFNAKIKIVESIRATEFFTENTYAELAEVYAYRVQSHSPETIKESAIIENENITFRFEFDFEKLSILHEIIYNGKYYNIVSFMPILGREEFVEVITRSS